MILRAFLLLAFALPVTAQTVYDNGFDAGDVAGWSTTVINPAFQRPISVAMTPVGARTFLGDFGSQTVEYAMSGLPAHDSIGVELDLFIINSWDGNAAGDDGPDLFIVRGDGREVIRTTFSNNVRIGQ